MFVAENSVIHMERSEKSLIHLDRAAESMWMTEFSVTYMLWSCFTLGFLSNSVESEPVLLRVATSSQHCCKVSTL
jgi:hypothetical protein